MLQCVCAWCVLMECVYAFWACAHGKCLHVVGHVCAIEAAGRLRGRSLCIVERRRVLRDGEHREASLYILKKR